MTRSLRSTASRPLRRARSPAAAWWCASAEKAALTAVLETARTQGFLGPGPIEEHIQHARDLAALLAPAPDRFLDLGAGGGIPGLVLALEWPASTAVLLDRRDRCGTFLRSALAELELSDRGEIITAPAETAARDGRLRARFPLVVARSFGAPAVTAECAVGFLAEGGALAVTEPPDADPLTRWPSEAIAELGLTGPETRRTSQTTAAVMTRTGPLDDRWPRREGRPAKRPLW